MTYAVGSQVPLPFTVRDSTGALVDCSTATIVVTQPDGTTGGTLTIGSGITKTATGTYVGLFTAAQAGRHVWTATTTGPIAARPPDAFNVTATTDAPITSLADARSWLGISNTSSDDLILRALSRATEVVEDWTGQLWRRTVVTETHDGGRSSVRLWRTPVLSVTTVTEAGVTLAASGYTLDTTVGLLYRGTSTSTYYWTHGVGAVVVTYVAGATIVPDRILGAVEELTRHIFSAMREGPQTSTDDEYAGGTPSVRRLCAMLLGPRMGTFA